MTYKCPLCLISLDGSQKLEGFCLQHAKSKGRKDRRQFSCTQEKLAEYLFCKQCGAACGETIDQGVFFRHVGCKSLNPFWNAERRKVIIPGEENRTKISFQLDFDTGTKQTVEVQHWLFGALWRLPDDSREMWFPQMMLRATAEKKRGRRIGTLLELVGPQGAGKTIVAIFAANYQGYNLNGSAERYFQLNDYIYSRTHEQEHGQLQTKGISYNRYIETLHFSSSLRNMRPMLFRPTGTVSDIGHLKVCFLRPAQFAPHRDDHDDEELSFPQRIRGHFRHPFRRLFSVILDGVSASNWYPFWHTAIFYDSAGEASEAGDLRPDLSAADKVVIVINANDIFPEAGKATSEESLRIAWQRIEQGLERRQNCYLVITQLDRVKQRMHEADWKQVARLADDLEADKNTQEAKALLKKWLVATDATDKSTGLTHRRQLVQRLRRVQKVFFVWTENLPESFVPVEHPNRPVSHGITKFICACLGIGWRQINQHQPEKE